MTTDRPPRPRDSRGRFVSSRDAAQGRALVVRQEEPQQDEPLMVSPDPDSRHLFLSFVWFIGAVAFFFTFPGSGWPAIVAFFIIFGAGFSLYFNLVICCGKRWPKTTLVVLIILCGMMGGRRRRW